MKCDNLTQSVVEAAGIRNTCRSTNHKVEPPSQHFAPDLSDYASSDCWSTTLCANIAHFKMGHRRTEGHTGPNESPVFPKQPQTFFCYSFSCLLTCNYVLNLLKTVLLMEFPTSSLCTQRHLLLYESLYGSFAVNRSPLEADKHALGPWSGFWLLSEDLQYK